MSRRRRAATPSAAGCPAGVSPVDGCPCGPGTTWTGLTIHETVGGGAEEPDAAEAVVEFTARYEHRAGAGSAAPARATGTQPGAMRERSLSRRRAGRWFYVEAL